MKKLLSLVLAAVLVLTGCTAAGSSTASSAAQSGDAASSQPASAGTGAVSLPETLVYDADGITITATGLDMQGFLGPTISFLIENDSAQNIIVQTDGCAVDGWMTDVTFSCDVAAGKKANDELTLLPDTLTASYIAAPHEIQLVLTILDDSYQTIVKTDPVALTTDAPAPTFSAPAGESVYEDEALRVLHLGTADSLLGQGVSLYLENNGTEPIVVTSQDVSVDGFMVTDSLYAQVWPGARKISTLTLLDDSSGGAPAEGGDVTFSLHLFNPDDLLDQSELGPFTVAL